MRKIFFILLVLTFSLSKQGLQAQDKINFLVSAAPTDYPLYVNCKNYVSFYSPKKIKKLQFEVDNGKIEYIGEGGLKILPSEGGKLTLFIKNKRGKTLSKKTFRVFPVPAPKIVLQSTYGNEINPEFPLNKSRVVAIAPKANDNFKAILPEETNFEIKSIEVRVFRGGRAVHKVSQKMSMIDLEKFKLEGGEGVQIKVMSVQRKSSTGDWENIRPANAFISFYVK